MIDRKERIRLGMSTKDIVFAMSGGNPGAVRVCMEILTTDCETDPLAGGYMPLLQLDNLNIWDSRIWMLYKDVCGESLPKLLTVIRAYQMGELGGATEDAINHAIDNRGDGLDLDAIMVAVKERLPEFNQEV